MEEYEDWSIEDEFLCYECAMTGGHESDCPKRFPIARSSKPLPKRNKSQFEDYLRELGLIAEREKK